ncbi:MAG: ROK family protein [Candidatus Doudnabacteria bacterium]|nr:ROK family protein [Candidatus Doudnabacteria bacterium]
MYIVFDIGGTTTRFASSIDGSAISDTKTEPTPQNLDDAITLYKKMVNDLANGQKIDGIAGGIAGPFNAEKTMLVNAPHLPQWVNKPLDQKFQTIADCPIFLENDTAVAGLGEAARGAGHGYKIVAYLAVGTGIGGSRIVAGRIDANSIGFEPGHMVVAKDQTLEQEISGTTIMQIYHKKASELEDPAYWHEFEQELAVGLNNITVMWSPDIIVLGGGVILQAQVNIDRVSLLLYKVLKIYPKLPRVVKATLGDHSGIEGSLVYLKQKLGS